MGSRLAVRAESLVRETCAPGSDGVPCQGNVSRARRPSGMRLRLSAGRPSVPVGRVGRHGPPVGSPDGRQGSDRCAPRFDVRPGTFMR